MDFLLHRLIKKLDYQHFRLIFTFCVRSGAQTGASTSKTILVLYIYVISSFLSIKLSLYVPLDGRFPKSTPTTTSLLGKASQ